MIRARLPDRGTDPAGSGEFGAPRGIYTRGPRKGKPRYHNGIDKTCFPDSIIYAPVEGSVSKLGYPYRDDLLYRYVQITDSKGRDHRVFYIEPMVLKGEYVNEDSEIGKAQNICARYPGEDMQNHVHYEIRSADGKSFIDPNSLV